jgi:hypothetical protein
MSTQSQIDANRRNARKSTGPRTRAGKAAVRLNSLWHGGFATDILLPGENAAAFSQLRDQFRGLYKPVSQAEEFLVSRLILAAWRLQRLAGMESRVLRAHAGLSSANGHMLNLVEAAILRTKPEPEPSPEDSADSDPIALAWIRDSNGANALTKLARFQNSLERSFYRALHELQLLRGELRANTKSQERTQ